MNLDGLFDDPAFVEREVVNKIFESPLLQDVQIKTEPQEETKTTEPQIKSSAVPAIEVKAEVPELDWPTAPAPPPPPRPIRKYTKRKDKPIKEDKPKRKRGRPRKADALARAEELKRAEEAKHIKVEVKSPEKRPKEKRRKIEKKKNEGASQGSKLGIKIESFLPKVKQEPQQTDWLHKFSCWMCGSRFGTQSDYVAHLATHSENNSFPAEMLDPSADLEVKQEPKLAAKENRVKPGLIRYCELCPERERKWYASLSLLNQHKRSHSKQRKTVDTVEDENVKYVWNCKLCDKWCINQAQLFEHQKEMHGFVGQSCEDCGLVFSRSFSLNRHKRSRDCVGNQPKIPPKPELKQQNCLVCFECNLRFVRPEILAAHMTLHFPKRLRISS